MYIYIYIDAARLRAFPESIPSLRLRVWRAVTTSFLVEFRRWRNAADASRWFRNWSVCVDRDRVHLNSTAQSVIDPSNVFFIGRRLSPRLERKLRDFVPERRTWIVIAASHNLYDLQCLDWNDTPRRRLAVMSTAMIVGWVTAISPTSFKFQCRIDELVTNRHPSLLLSLIVILSLSSHCPESRETYKTLESSRIVF